LSQRRAKLLSESRRQALDLLTPEQRAEWEKLAGQRRTGDVPQPSRGP
jgi:Spy/CpxP family protein refolding chaperone